MKLFNFIIFYCIFSCLITLLSTFYNNEFNYISVGLSLFGIIVSLISKYYKNENLLYLILVWYLFATFISEAVKFDLVLKFESNIDFSIGKLGLNFKIFYLIPLIIIIIFYDRLSLLRKKLSGSVHTESSQIPFGTKIDFEFNDFNGKKLLGTTNINLDGESYKQISFEKMKGMNKSLGGIDIFNENNKLSATIKMD